MKAWPKVNKKFIAVKCTELIGYGWLRVNVDMG